LRHRYSLRTLHTGWKLFSLDIQDEKHMNLRMYTVDNIDASVAC